MQPENDKKQAPVVRQSAVGRLGICKEQTNSVVSMDDLREKIVKQSVELFLKYGIRSVSIDDICKQMGISKKTFYVYFKQKSDLVEAILTYNESRMGERIQKGMTQKPILELLLDAALRTRQMQEIQKPPQLIFDLHKYYPQLIEEHKKIVVERAKVIVAQCLHKGIEEGVFWDKLDVETCADFFARTYKNFMEQVNHPDFKFSTHKRTIDFAIGLFIRGLVSPEGARQAREIMERKNQKKI